MQVPNTALAEAIEASGFRKDFIATQVGIAPATLSRYLSGTRDPELVIREKLALLLRRRPDDFVRHNDDGADSAAAPTNPVGKQAA